jgi:hypothetical protein
VKRHIKADAENNKLSQNRRVLLFLGTLSEGVVNDFLTPLITMYAPIMMKITAPRINGAVAFM